ncbi:MAG: urease accessory protein [Nitrospirales bacterium]|nr:urease accessory protein [Nitrospirales bacterium]
MLSILGLGFLMGMRHACESDHAAAVASLATRSGSIAQTVKQGMVWGLGHTLTLLIFSSLVLMLGSIIPEQFAHGLELMVGMMLVGLGIDVFRRMRKNRIHFHIHQHPDRLPHFHAHGHTEPAHPDNTSHDHAHGFPYRALLVGLMHGMAGSAALILVTLNTTLSASQAIIYILLFGVGSTIGMGLLSLIMAIPFWYSARSLTWLHNGLQACVGVMTTILGVLMALSSGSSLWD